METTIDLSKDWIHEGEAARILGVTRQRINQLVHEGTFTLAKLTENTRLLSRSEVESRIGTVGGPDRKRTICFRGHDLTDNTYTVTTPAGKEQRRCKTCTRKYQKDYRNAHATNTKEQEGSGSKS